MKTHVNLLLTLGLISLPCLSLDSVVAQGRPDSVFLDDARTVGTPPTNFGGIIIPPGSVGGQNDGGVTNNGRPEGAEKGRPVDVGSGKPGDAGNGNSGAEGEGKSDRDDAQPGGQAQEEDQLSSPGAIIPSGDLPAIVLAVLEGVAPGLKITSVQLEKGAPSDVYIIKGRFEGHTVKFEITAKGELLSRLKGDVDNDPDPLNGCTRGTGYWATHSDDPAWKKVGAARSFFYSGGTYLEMMQTAAKGDAYVTLAHAYIGALLNEANGVTPLPEIQLAIDASTKFFGRSAPGIGPSSSSGAGALALADLLDAFNRGLLGASSCGGESDAPGAEDEPGNEGSAPGEVATGGSPLDVDFVEIPSGVNAGGLVGLIELKVATEPGVSYRVECLSPTLRWQPLGGRFGGDGTEKVVRIPLSRTGNCTLYRVKVLSDGNSGAEAPVDQDEA